MKFTAQEVMCDRDLLERMREEFANDPELM